MDPKIAARVVERFLATAKETRVPVRNKEKGRDTKVLPDTLKKYPHRYLQRKPDEEEYEPPKPRAEGFPVAPQDPREPAKPAKPRRPHTPRDPFPRPDPDPKRVKPVKPVKAVPPVKPVKAVPLVNVPKPKPRPLLPGQERGERPDWAQAKKRYATTEELITLRVLTRYYGFT